MQRISFHSSHIVVPFAPALKNPYFIVQMYIHIFVEKNAKWSYSWLCYY